jgi:hypothetical protein
MDTITSIEAQNEALRAEIAAARGALADLQWIAAQLADKRRALHAARVAAVKIPNATGRWLAEGTVRRLEREISELSRLASQST